jgi:hypothetical protein
VLCLTDEVMSKNASGHMVYFTTAVKIGQLLEVLIFLKEINAQTLYRI